MLAKEGERALVVRSLAKRVPKGVASSVARRMNGWMSG